MSKEKPTCTCPSGDGSLRWPCQEHGVSAELLAELESKASLALDANITTLWYDEDACERFVDDSREAPFIATASPAIILALIAHIRAQAAELESLRQAAPVAVPDERKAFEAWQNKDGWKRPDDAGEWDAWQSRAMLAAAPSAPEPAAQELVAQCPFCGESSGHCDQGFPHPGKTAKTPPAAEQPDTVKVPRQLLEDAAHWLDAHASSGSAEAYIARELRALLGKEGE